MSYSNAPEDEQIFPPWMDREFFQKVLIESHKDNSVKVNDFLLKPGSNKGDHYASVMYRSVVNYETSKEKNLEINLIIKIMPFIEGMKKDFLNDSGVFNTEIKIYSKTLPMIQETLAKVGDNTQIACKSIYTSMEPHQILIFEDLTKQNYKPVCGIDGSFPSVKIALSKLAKYHAVSFKINSETGEIKKDYEKNQFDVEKLKQMPMFRDGFPFFLDMLKTIPDLQEYVPIFERILANSPVDKAYLMFDNCKANWMVLTHGDFHLKNTMIRYNDDESVDDILLIDFQACCWGPVVTDIIYMLYLMLDSKDRLERRDEAVYHYYKEFTDTIHQIGFSGDFPKLSDLYKDILLFKDYELLLAISLLPYVPQAMRGGVEIEVFMNNEQMRRDLYQQADYHDEVRKLLPYFLHRGYLD